MSYYSSLFAKSDTTRPSNTTPAYTAGAVYGGLQTFSAIGISNSSVVVTSVSLRLNITSVPSGMAAFRLHLYSATPSALLDKAVWSLTNGDRSIYEGFVDLVVPAAIGSSILYSQNDYINKQIKLTTSTLYGYLVTLGTYTPASGTTSTIEIHGVQV
jgi:hypothetical protein